MMKQKSGDQRGFEIGATENHKLDYIHNSANDILKYFLIFPRQAERTFLFFSGFGVSSRMKMKMSKPFIWKIRLLSSICHLLSRDW